LNAQREMPLQAEGTVAPKKREGAVSLCRELCAGASRGAGVLLAACARRPKTMGLVAVAGMAAMALPCAMATQTDWRIAGYQSSINWRMLQSAATQCSEQMVFLKDLLRMRASTCWPTGVAYLDSDAEYRFASCLNEKLGTITTHGCGAMLRSFIDEYLLRLGNCVAQCKVVYSSCLEREYPHGVDPIAYCNGPGRFQECMSDILS